MMKQDKERQAAGKDVLEIYTLGPFKVKYGDKLLSDDASRSNKLWELFKYFLTYRDKRIPSEIILEHLWPDKDYTDPRRSLRTMIHRLRNVISNGLPAENSPCSIVFSHGCYNLVINADCMLDVQEFENCCEQAYSLIKVDPVKAIEIYQQAISLYRGDYLPECSFNEWVMPVKNYYRRVYLQSVFELTTLLKNHGMHSEIVKVCEKVFQIEPFGEEFHLRFMEALLEEGKSRQARAHYEYVTSIFYREMEIKPSHEMRNIYRLTQVDTDKVEMDLSMIYESLKDRQKRMGAFPCDPDLFRFVYRLEKNRGERSNQPIFLVLFTLIQPDYSLPEQGVLKESMKQLKEVILKNLRKGDLIAHWNEAQFLLLFSGLTPEQVEIVVNRIKTGFQEKNKLKGVLLQSKFQKDIPIQAN